MPGIRRNISVFEEANGNPVAIAGLKNEEFKKIRTAINTFDTLINTTTKPKFNQANSKDEVLAVYAEFRKLAIDLILYVLDADPKVAPQVLDAKNYSKIKSMVSNLHTYTQEMYYHDLWDTDNQKACLTWGVNGLYKIIQSLKDVENVISNAEKPKTLFNRNPVSLASAKLKVTNILDKLIDEDSQLKVFCNNLQSLTGIYDDQRLDRLAGGRGSSVSSAGEEATEETAGRTLQEPPSGNTQHGEEEGKRSSSHSSQHRPN